MSARCVPVSGSSNPMIKKRPTLATGHSLAGLPAVTKVLHSDERCEVYSLASSGGSETILLLVRRPRQLSALGDASVGRLVDYSASASSYRPPSARR